MRKLLESPYQRLISILEILVLQDDWITTRKLASAIDASERTVLNDLKLIKNNWGHCLNVETSTNKGINVKNRNIAILNDICKDIFNSSIILRWLKEILFHPKKSIEYYEERLFVSRSTLLRMVPGINRFFSERKIYLRHRNNRFELTADDEQYLRQYFAAFLIELNGLDLESQNINVDLDLLSDIVQKMVLESCGTAPADIFVNDQISRSYLMMFCLVSLLRENQGFATDVPLSKDLLNADALEPLIKPFPNITAANFRPIQQFISNQYQGWDNAVEEAVVNNEAKALLNRLFAGVKIQPDAKTFKNLHVVLKTLYLKAKYCPMDTSELFDRIYYFSLSVQKYNPAFFRLVQDELAIFSENTHMHMSTYIPAFIFWSYLLAPQFCHPAKTVTALVISDFGLQHAMFLAERIMSFCVKNGVANIKATAVELQNAFNPVVYQNYDIIITTVFGLDIPGKTSVLVNDFPTYDNFYEINKVVASQLQPFF